MTFFSAKNITAGYGGKIINSEISFDMDAGCILGILGANGSGKTTLLKSLCGILPHEGTCMLQDTVLEDLSSRQLAGLCSYIPQRSGIGIDISALDVVLMGFNPQLGILQHPDSSMKERARQMLKEVGLEGKEHMNYLHLSEGQKQMCILARTLVSDSRLLLLDEPESALDFQYRYQMLKMIRKWVKEEERGALVTLHDPSLALNCCDRLLLLSDGQVLDTICPSSDELEKMENLLRKIYGPVSLLRCRGRNGREQLIMIREDEE